MEHPTQQGIRNLLENGTSITTGLYKGADQISGAAERLSFDAPVAGDVQFIMIMTIFEWKSGMRLTFDPEVGFEK